MTHPFVQLAPGDLVLDDLPDEIHEARAAREHWMRAVDCDSPGFQALVSDVDGWRPGQTIRVAFLGGNTELHRAIEETTRELTRACNLELDMGFDPHNGRYRAWSEDDQTYAAEIRVSFDMGGYWSLVGTDSIDPEVGDPSARVGGRPHQRTLNLGGFDAHLPNATWRGTVLHEFLHALAFHHEHQNTSGPCQDDFRWEDDPGYVPTTDPRGAFVPDASGLRPGIYTYLSGFPNRWSREKIDRNLRASGDHPLVSTAFDRASVMLYRFPPLFYRTDPCECQPLGDGQALSEGDVNALRRLYPHTQLELGMLETRRDALVERLSEHERLARDLQGVSRGFATDALRRIRRRWTR